jgi:hypothetical protein
VIWQALFEISIGCLLALVRGQARLRACDKKSRNLLSPNIVVVLERVVIRSKRVSNSVSNKRNIRASMVHGKWYLSAPSSLLCLPPLLFTQTTPLLSPICPQKVAQPSTPLAKDRTFVFSTTEKSLPNVKSRYLKPSNALLYTLLYKKPKKKGSAAYTHTDALKCENVTPNPIMSILSFTKAKLLPLAQKAAMYALRSPE